MSHAAKGNGGRGNGGQGGGQGGYMDTIQNFFGSLKGQAIKYEDQVLDVVEAGIGHVETRAKQLHSSLATLSSAEARQAAMAQLKRQAKEIEAMFTEDETKKYVSGGVATYIHSLERALEVRLLPGTWPLSTLSSVEDTGSETRGSGITAGPRFVE